VPQRQRRVPVPVGHAALGEVVVRGEGRAHVARRRRGVVVQEEDLDVVPGQALALADAAAVLQGAGLVPGPAAELGGHRDDPVGGGVVLAGPRLGDHPQLVRHGEGVAAQLGEDLVHPVRLPADRRDLHDQPAEPPGILPEAGVVPPLTSGHDEELDGGPEEEDQQEPPVPVHAVPFLRDGERLRRSVAHVDPLALSALLHRRVSEVAPHSRRGGCLTRPGVRGISGVCGDPLDRSSDLAGGWSPDRGRRQRRLGHDPATRGLSVRGPPSAGPSNGASCGPRTAPHGMLRTPSAESVQIRQRQPSSGARWVSTLSTTCAL
jgi:hypothetical protein